MRKRIFVWILIARGHVFYSAKQTSELGLRTYSWTQKRHTKKKCVFIQFFKHLPAISYRVIVQIKSQNSI